METNVNYTIVGIFVISMISAVVLAVIWLSSGLSLQQYSTFAVYMQESVSGLGIDSPVEFNGVDVGAVKSIQLNPSDPHLVQLLLSIKSDAPITQGTVATLNTRGVTGLTFLALKDMGADLRPLRAQPGQPYPVIKTAPSIFKRLDTILSQLSDNFGKVTEAIASILDKQNQALFKDSLENIQRITHTLAVNSEQMNTILNNTAKASRDLAPLMQSGTSAIRSFQYQTLPAAYRTLSNLDEITRNLSEISVQLKQNPSILVRGAAQQPLGPGEKR